MHITSGRLKGRTIETPPRAKTRPTSGKLRQAFFNIVAPYIEGASFLDLCAGSGAMGFEAMSCGAARATFVDSSSDACQTIRHNAKKFELELETRILKSDIIRALHLLVQEGAAFDLIYFDPPYDDTNLTAETLSYIDQHRTLLGKEGLLFLETSRRQNVEIFSLQQLTLESKRQSGDSMLIMYKNHY